MRQIGSQHDWTHADGILRPGHVVQIQHRQPRQGCQQTQVLDANRLFTSATQSTQASLMRGCQNYRQLPCILLCHVSFQVQVFSKGFFEPTAMYDLLQRQCKCRVHSGACRSAVSTCGLNFSPDLTSSASCSHVNVLQAAIACGGEKTIFKLKATAHLAAFTNSCTVAYNACSHTSSMPYSSEPLLQPVNSTLRRSRHGRNCRPAEACLCE